MVFERIPRSISNTNKKIYWFERCDQDYEVFI